VPRPDPELLRELDRVADRVRVMAPRLAARTGPEPEQALAAVRTLLQQLADLAADAEELPRRPVPELGAHALADQLVVLGRDVAGACAEPALADAQELLVALRRAL
jgi:hypothetical protein